MTFLVQGRFMSVCSTHHQSASSIRPPWPSFKRAPVRLLLEHGATSALIYLRVDDVHATIESLRADDVEIVTERYVICRHSDDSLGPAGTDEWLSFVRDSEGNLLGLVSHQTPQDS
jgi:methylmalonyl-CoA/ethylmalonyl-CoA epimerase